MASASLTEVMAGCCASRVLLNTLDSGSSREVVPLGCSQRGSFQRVVLRTRSCGREAWRPVAASMGLPSTVASPMGQGLGQGEMGFREEQHVEGAREVAQADPSVALEEEGSSAASQEQATAVPTGGGGGFAVRRRGDPRNSSPAKRPPFARNVTVALDQLVPGTIFSGKVVAIESFGAFIDIGAFTDGLLHISQIKDDYIRDVREYVSIGQEVKVKVTAVDAGNGRISFTMRGLTEDGVEVPRQEERRQRPVLRQGTQGAVGTESVQGRPVRSGKIAGRGRQGAEQPAKSVGVKKGQEVTGVVKNIIRNGVFLTLDSGDEGYLRASDAHNPSNLTMESLYTIGQSLDVRVVRVERGRISLTMKKEVDLKQMNQTINNNESFVASNPFETAFRQANILVTPCQDSSLGN